VPGFPGKRPSGCKPAGSRSSPPSCCWTRISLFSPCSPSGGRKLAGLKPTESDSSGAASGLDSDGPFGNTSFGMIAEEDRDTIIRLARKYGVAEVVLFGSSLVKGKDSHDIDLGVKGIDPRLFFRFYGELMMSLPKPVDVVDLSQRSRFTDLVERRGVKILG